MFYSYFVICTFFLPPGITFRKRLSNVPPFSHPGSLKAVSPLPCVYYVSGIYIYIIRAVGLFFLPLVSYPLQTIHLSYYYFFPHLSSSFLLYVPFTLYTLPISSIPFCSSFMYCFCLGQPPFTAPRACLTIPYLQLFSTSFSFVYSYI